MNEYKHEEKSVSVLFTPEELAQMQLDARRYRWIRAHSGCRHGEAAYDEMIDRLMNQALAIFRNDVELGVLE